MQYFAATGRRKNAVARARISQGTGKRIANGVPLKKYLSRKTLEMVVEQPFKIIDLSDKLDLNVNVKGGGLSGQAGAIRHAATRALLKYDETLRENFKKNGFLTRDPRMVERKKAGQPKARKRFQFSKR